MVNPFPTVRPWCFGHFVIGLPTQSAVSAQEFAYDGYKIETVRNVSQSEFQTRVAARENELRTKRRVDPSDGNVPTKSALLQMAASPDQHSRILVFSDVQVPDVDLSFDVEGYAHAGSNMYILKTQADSEYLPKLVTNDGPILTGVRYREDQTIPTEKGFCFEGGYITGKTSQSEDVVQSFALLPGKPALLNIEIRDAVDTDGNTSLLSTLPDLRRQIESKGVGGQVKVLREGKRKLAGMDAEEVLMSVGDGATHLYRFYLLANGSPSNAAEPHTSVEMDLGDLSPGGKLTAQDASPLDEASAIAAWDALLNSMHLRPGAL
ncbi:MAG: T6SS immunity protein Tli4 family protein [Paraburkholderia sp.]|nr:T6SS immunity protein Tli4 family protein [Burkholderia sp. 4M9327F10]